MKRKITADEACKLFDTHKGYTTAITTKNDSWTLIQYFTPGTKRLFLEENRYPNDTTYSDSTNHNHKSRGNTVMAPLVFLLLLVLFWMKVVSKGV